MTLHQINGDGAGPMSCSVDPTAKGDNFQDMKISTNVPGNNGKSGAANQDFPLVAQMPAGVTCTGTVAGQNNLCMVKCQNPAGPFGGVVPVQSGGNGGAAGGANGASGTTSATTTAATGAVGTGQNGGQNAGTAANNTTNIGGTMGNKGATTGKGKGKGRKSHRKHRIYYLD